jgi:hypothetical protein
LLGGVRLHSLPIEGSFKSRAIKSLSGSDIQDLRQVGGWALALLEDHASNDDTSIVIT